jgi:hypothetical protein
MKILKELNMAKSVYKMFLSRFTEAWYQLSSEEQGRMIEKIEAALAQTGGKRVVLCDSTWSSEQWAGFGVEVFPDIEAVQKHTALLNEINWFRYIESTTLLGTDIQS